MLNMIPWKRIRNTILKLLKRINEQVLKVTSTPVLISNLINNMINLLITKPYLMYNPIIIKKILKIIN